MRYPLVAFLAVLLVTCGTEPSTVATTVPMPSPSPLPSATPAASATQAEEGPSFTATFSGAEATVTNHTDSPAWVEVAWELQQPDGRWWRYYVEAHSIPAGAESRYHPDCLFPGTTLTVVLGHGLFHRSWYGGVAYCR
jgi:hypothetical protein